MKHMNMKIDEDIKANQYSRVYLLYGEERYLLTQKKILLVETLRGGDEMNFAKWEDPEPNASDIIGFAETLPFLAEYRVAVVTDSGYFKKAAPEELVEYIENIPETTVLIFSESEVDKRSKMYKAVLKHGAVVEYPRESEATLLQWITKVLREDGKKISRDTLADFLSRTGNDMVHIRSELDKLLAYCLEKDEITKKDLDAVLSSINTDNIFRLVDAVGEGDRARAFALYRIFLDKRESPYLMLWNLTRLFEKLLQIREMDDQRMSLGLMADRMGMKDWQVKKNLPLARKFSPAFLRRLIKSSVKAEENFKNGRMNDKTAIELFLAESLPMRS